jgi:hypothetical protein
MGSLNLQRNSEVFFSTVDLNGGAAVAAMTPNNTWKIEVLAGFALTSSAATQDITSMESGLNPDRSQQRFNTAINPVDWNFQTYIRPTGAVTGNAVPVGLAAGVAATGNVKPVADWFMWQALTSNTKPASASNIEQSVWSTGGRLTTANTAASTGSHSTRTNFAIAQENFLYFHLDNVFYQINQATVNQATVDAGIEEIATTTWTGMGTTMIELTGTPRNNAVSVFGGILNSGASVNANANTAATATIAYHPYNQMSIAGANVTNSFIKNRLSAITFNHAALGITTANTYTFPVTALTFDYTNNMTYITPEELSILNTPIGQFVGTRAVTGSATMYLRNDSNESAQFLRNIANDSRTNSAQTSNANLIIGGSTGPYVAFFMPAVQFEFPQLSVDDVIGMSVNFVAQETTANKGGGGEVTMYAAKV